MPYDLFVSYSRKDNAQGQVTALLERIREDYRTFAGEDLACFFDLDDIHGMEDWRHRILEGLRHSSLLLLVLSPAYVKSDYCTWEIVEYLKYEHARAALGQGVAPVYFVELPGKGSPDFPAEEAAWLAQVRRRNRFDLRPWYQEGADALKRQDVRTRLEDLEKSLHDRLSKLRRLASAPGNLPAHNPRFVGREPEMLRLHQSAGVGVFGVLTALQGMGGLGKTALAIQYACAYADFYPGGRWLLGCAGRHGLAGIVRELDVDLGLQLAEDERRDDLRAAKRVLAELERRAREGAAARVGERTPPEPRALLLLDNVDDPALLQPPESDLLTGKHWLHVLATTRLAPEDFGHDAARQTLLEVDALPEEDALRLIESLQPGERFANESERTAAREIVRRLGGFTLAVEVIGVYLGECAGRVSCAALAQRLASEGPGGIDGVARQTKRNINHVEKLIAATLGPTLDLLAPAESLVLAYAALLPPDSIPLPWIRALVAEDYPELGRDAPAGYSDPWADLVNRLLGLRLLQLADTDPESQAPRLVRMHRLVGELVRWREVSPKTHSRRFGSLADLALGRSEHLEKNWFQPAAKWEIEPIVSFTENLLADKSPRAPQLVKYLGQWYSHLDWTRSERMHRDAIALLAAPPAPDELEIAILSSNLGWILKQQGRLDEAEPLLRKALGIDEKLRDSGHRFIFIRLTILALVLQAKGDLAGAESLLRRAIDGYEQTLGPAHPDTLKCVSNLASVLQAKGDLAGAEPFLRRAIEGCERTLGATHPDTLSILNNLATLLYAKGDFCGAESICRRALDGYELALGPAHPDTLKCVSNLASVLQAKGDLAGAEPFLRRAIEGCERTLGATHPASLSALNNLANLLYAKGDLCGAEALCRRAKRSREQTLGLAHPDTLVSVNNLAAMLLAKGDFAGAEPLYRRALEGRERALGPAHPDTLASVQGLADLLERTGRAEEAKPLRLRRIQAITAKTNTPPLELRTAALDAYRLGDYALAGSLLQRALTQGFEVAGTHVHLARIALLTGDAADAADHAAQAWAHRTEAPPYVVPRILWLQLAALFPATADSHKSGLEPSVLLGRLKTALQTEGAQAEWAMDPVLARLDTQIPPKDHAFLTALVAALSFPDKLAALEAFPAWRDAEPQPLT